MLCPLFLTTSSFPPTVMNQNIGTMTNTTSTEISGDLNSAKRSSVHDSPSSLAWGSGSTSVTMSVDALLNSSKEKEEEKEDDRIVNMLSLNTKASHASLRPIPLVSNSYRSTSTDESSKSTPCRPRNQSDASETRKRSREGDEEGDEIQYLGRTPSTWKKWEASGGVRSENGSPYCYAYDDNGQRRSLIPA